MINPAQLPEIQMVYNQLPVNGVFFPFISLVAFFRP